MSLTKWARGWVENNRQWHDLVEVFAECHRVNFQALHFRAWDERKLEHVSCVCSSGGGSTFPVHCFSRVVEKWLSLRLHCSIRGSNGIDVGIKWRSGVPSVVKTGL